MLAWVLASAACGGPAATDSTPFELALTANGPAPRPKLDALGRRHEPPVRSFHALWKRRADGRRARARPDRARRAVHVPEHARARPRGLAARASELVECPLQGARRLRRTREAAALALRGRD